MSGPALALDADYSLSPQDKELKLSLDRRAGETLEDLKKDPARAMALSLLYPGLGHFYIGNDNTRSTWIMVGGTAIIVGSIVGWNLLKDRSQGTVANDLQKEDGSSGVGVGDILIAGVLVGYHLWNVRDAFEQAELYNHQLESDSLLSAIDNLRLTYDQDTLFLNYKLSL